VNLHGLRRGAGRVLTPEREREPIGAHRFVGVQQQHGEHRARLDPAERDGAVVPVGLQRPEDEEAHRPTVPGQVHQRRTSCLLPVCKRVARTLKELPRKLATSAKPSGRGSE